MDDTRAIDLKFQVYKHIASALERHGEVLRLGSFAMFSGDMSFPIRLGGKWEVVNFSLNDGQVQFLSRQHYFSLRPKTREALREICAGATALLRMLE